MEQQKISASRYRLYLSTFKHLLTRNALLDIIGSFNKKYKVVYGCTVRSGFRGDSLLFIEIIDNLQEDAECIHTKHEAWKIYDQRLPYLIDDLKERIHKWKDT